MWTDVDLHSVCILIHTCTPSASVTQPIQQHLDWIHLVVRDQVTGAVAHIGRICRVLGEEARSRHRADKRSQTVQWHQGHEDSYVSDKLLFGCPIRSADPPKTDHMWGSTVHAHEATVDVCVRFLAALVAPARLVESSLYVDRHAARQHDVDA